MSGQRGGSSKDTWVLSDAPVAPAAPAGRAARGRATRAASARRRAARRSTCSGWGATRSAARTARGCCAPCCAGCTDAGERSGRRSSVRAFLRALRTVTACSTSRSRRPRTRAPRWRSTRADRRAARSPAAPQPRGSTSSRRSASPAPCAIGCRRTTGACSTACSQLFDAPTRARRDLDDALELIDDVHPVARGGRRARDGAHDARRRLAVPEPRPPPRTAVLRRQRRSATSRRSRRRPDPAAARVAARPVGQPASRTASATCSQPEWRAVVDLLLVRRAQPAVGACSSWRSSPSTSGCCRMPSLDRGRWRRSSGCCTTCRADVDADQGELFDRDERGSRRC